MNLAAAYGIAAASMLLTSCGEVLPVADQTAKRQPAPSATPLESNNAKAAYQFANLPDGFSDVFKPDEGSQKHYIAYMKDIDRAYFEMRQGHFAKAIELFAAIGSETLFETPNDATWAGHAESLCRAGDKPAGRKQLVEAQCSHQLLSYRQSCNDLDSRKSESDFPSACYREYCEAEILRPDYEQTSTNHLGPNDRQRLERYARHLKHIESLCR